MSTIVEPAPRHVVYGVGHLIQQHRADGSMLDANRKAAR